MSAILHLKRIVFPASSPSFTVRSSTPVHTRHPEHPFTGLVSVLVRTRSTSREVPPAAYGPTPTPAGGVMGVCVSGVGTIRPEPRGGGSGDFSPCFPPHPTGEGRTTGVCRQERSGVRRGLLPPRSGSSSRPPVWDVNRTGPVRVPGPGETDPTAEQYPRPWEGEDPTSGGDGVGREWEGPSKGAMGVKHEGLGGLNTRTQW